MISPSQRPLPDNTQQSQQTNIHSPGGIRTHDRSRRAAVDLRLRQRGYWDRLRDYITHYNIFWQNMSNKNNTKQIYKQRCRLGSFVVLCVTQNVLNMELTFLAVDSTLLKTHSNLVYIHIFYIHMSLNRRTQFLLSVIYLILLPGFRLPYCLIKTFCLVLV
jgi:hypothetical protein